MMRMAILCEGYTEREFVDTVLRPHFWEMNAYIEASIVGTSKASDGTKHRGGYVTPEKLTRELRNLCGGFECVSMMFDYYGFRADQWRDLPGELPLAPRQRKQRLEAAVAKAVDCSRFVPNLILHE